MDEREETRQRRRVLTLRRGAMVVPAHTETKSAERKPPVRKSAVRNNSEVDTILVEHAEGIPLSHLRRNSCSCAACGGEKLARKYLRAYVPTGEPHSQTFALNSLKALAALIRNYRKEDQSEMPGLTAIRLSVILKLHEPPNLYVKPPETPRLRQLLQSSSTAPVQCTEKPSVQDFFARNDKWLARYRVCGAISRKANTQRGNAVQNCASLTLSTSADSAYKERLSPFRTPTSASLHPLQSPQKLRPHRSAGKFPLPSNKGRLVI